MRVFLKSIVVFLILMFVLFAVVQWNDPDPYVWMPVYLLFAVLGLSVLFRPMKPVYYLAFGAVAIFFAVLQWPVKWEGFGDSMINENTERARESAGLLIGAAGTVFYMLILRYLKAKKSPTAR